MIAAVFTIGTVSLLFYELPHEAASLHFKPFSLHTRPHPAKKEPSVYNVTLAENTRERVQEREKKVYLRKEEARVEAVAIKPPSPTPVSTPLMDVIHDLFEIGITQPAKLVHLLDSTDPLSVNVSVPLFQCPTKGSVGGQRLDHPYLYSEQTSDRFKRNVKSEPSFLFFQHLRKAGGTTFCDLAQTNMPKKTVPGYYCMPDRKGSMATPPWNNPNYLVEQMTNKGYRITANEWDAFYEEFLDLPGAVFASSFREPVDRWYSQYRFEHLEHRDGSKQGTARQSFPDWYRQTERWSMGRNYYVKTFEGTKDKTIPKNADTNFYWTYHKFRTKALRRQENADTRLDGIHWEFFLRALTNVRRFHLVLVTEWLDHAQPLFKQQLGWVQPPRQVLPHEVQAKRGGNYKSKVARDVLAPKEWQEVAEDNCLDLLFVHVVKRIFLERLSCL